MTYHLVTSGTCDVRGSDLTCVSAACLCSHGQCDNRPDSDGRCKADSCLPGFTGPFCDRQTAACGVQAQFCHAHADCDFSQGTARWIHLWCCDSKHLYCRCTAGGSKELVRVLCVFRCVCKPGYQGDGITCVESDPCAPPLRGGCSVNVSCSLTIVAALLSRSVMFDSALPPAG